MNIEQLGGGTLHIGFFFLLAAISGLAAWALAASIKPVERMWIRGQNNYGEHEFGVEDNYEWVTKKMIIWGWVCRKSSLANALRTLWGEAKEQIFAESGECYPERIPRFHRQVARRLLIDLLYRGRENLKMFFCKYPDQALTT